MWLCRYGYERRDKYGYPRFEAVYTVSYHTLKECIDDCKRCFPSYHHVRTLPDGTREDVILQASIIKCGDVPLRHHIDNTHEHRVYWDTEQHKGISYVYD